MARLAIVEVVIDERKLENAVSKAEGTKNALNKKVSQIKTRANTLASGYRTKKWHDHKTGETKGNTQARYDGNVQRGKKGYVGIVYTANYSAQKENHEHNTLLKAKG